MSWSEVARLRDKRVSESSGLGWLSGSLLTVNDSGDRARVYVVDPGSGQTTAVWRFKDRKPRDVEALAVGPNRQVFVGDIGDNNGRRSGVSVYRFTAPEGNTGVDQEHRVQAEELKLQYPRSARDAEALMVHPQTGQILIASKGIFGGELYAAPVDVQPGQVAQLEQLRTLPALITDGAFSPDGSLLVLRSYAQVYTYSFPELNRLRHRELPTQRQGETLAINDAGEVFVGSEGRNSQVLQVTPKVPWGTPVDVPAGDATTPGGGPGQSGEAIGEPTAMPLPNPDGAAGPEGTETPMPPMERWQYRAQQATPTWLHPYLRFWPLLPVMLVVVVLVTGWWSRPRPWKTPKG